MWRGRVSLQKWYRQRRMGCMEPGRADRSACVVVVVAADTVADVAAGTGMTVVVDAKEEVPKQCFRMVAAEDHCSSASVGRLEEEEHRSQLPQH